MPIPTRPWSALVAASAVALVVAGCGADADDVARPAVSIQYTAGDVPVLVPGSPGDPTETIAPGETGRMENAGSWNDADVDFVERMVPHHAQALEMAALAPDRASDPRVLAIADRVASAQQPEIDLMQAWLEQQGLPPADPDDHSHAGMEGMVTDEQLFALRAAEGREFDRLFLEAMTQHHEGAITMAQSTSDNANIVITDLIQDVVVSQSVEITRMAQVLADL